MKVIDIHNHVLFDLDDGASLQESAVSMIETAAEQGVEILVCTPHFDREFKQIRRDCEERLAVLQETAPAGITLKLGLEVYLMQNLAELYRSQRIWTLNDSRYMLVELPMRQYPEYTETVFEELIALGVTPIIAHPERNQQLREQPELAQRLAKIGCRFQLNLPSIVGRHGEGIQKVAQDFLERGLYSCVGSDAHNESTRPTVMAEARAVLPEETFTYLMTQAEKILANQEINECRYQAPVPQKKSFFAKLFGK